MCYLQDINLTHKNIFTGVTLCRSIAEIYILDFKTVQVVCGTLFGYLAKHFFQCLMNYHYLFGAFHKLLLCYCIIKHIQKERRELNLSL